MTDHNNDSGLQKHGQEVGGHTGGDPVDADIVLIADYLASALSAEDEAAVERRLDDDKAFFEKVWPLLNAWQRSDDAQAPPRQVTPRVGTFTDEIRSMAALRPPAASPQRPLQPASLIARVARLFRRS